MNRDAALSNMHDIAELYRKTEKPLLRTLLSSPPALAADPLEMKQVVDVLSTPLGGEFLSSSSPA
jgi:hypothetical protein